MAKSNNNLIGSWAFVIGIVFAVVLGLLDNINEMWIIVLVVIGLIIGLLNISEKETKPFLISHSVLYSGGRLPVNSISFWIPSGESANM